MSGANWQDAAAAAIALLALAWLVRRRWRTGRGGATAACEGCERCAADTPPLARGESPLFEIAEPGTTGAPRRR